MVKLTKENIISELKKPGTLMELLNPEQFVEPNQVADELAEYYTKTKDKLKPTQLRKIFHALKAKERMFKGKSDLESLEQRIKAEIHSFIPELAYARARKLIPQEFYELMRLCLGSDKLQKVGDLRVLMQFLTAILAYHKYHEEKVEGGRE